MKIEIKELEQIIKEAHISGQCSTIDIDPNLKEASSYTKELIQSLMEKFKNKELSC